MAYMLRFMLNLKLKVTERSLGPLLPTEIDVALKILIKNAQIECFSQEYNNLSNKKEIHKKSKILSLNPFLQEGLLRVGGRIGNS